jgi:hypothetical protein
VAVSVAFVKPRLDLVLAALWLAVVAFAAGAQAVADDDRLPFFRAPSALVPTPQPGPPEITAGRRQRPDLVPPASASVESAPNAVAMFNDYDTPGRVVAGRRAVVHYVVRGVSAPPLNDDDGDGVPDYVERVAAAADTALAYYERRGFRAVRPDEGGPDARPDLYVSRLTPGTFGVAVPGCDAVDGAFVAVANTLDPSETESLGSLQGTVAHELFHLVQFAYFPREAEPALPDWVLEGSAAAMERRVHPGIADIVSSLQLRRWFTAPHRPITAQSYGAQLLWRFLDERYPQLLGALLDRFAGSSAAAEGERAFLATFRRLTGEDFAAVFHRFVLYVADAHGSALRPLRTLAVGPYSARLAPLAVHYVRLRVPHGRPYRLTLMAGDRRPLAATLVYRLDNETPGEPATIVRVRPIAARHGRGLVFRIPAAVTRSHRFAAPLLVISNGEASPTGPYRATSS